MLEVLTFIFKVLGASGICYILLMGLKLATVNIICKHPELSDNKVKYITKMISKDGHHSN